MANVKGLRADLRQARDGLRKAMKEAKPAQERGGVQKIETALGNQNVVFHLLGASAAAMSKRGSAIPAQQRTEILSHIVEALGQVAYLGLMRSKVLFEEPEYMIGEAIEHVEAALEIALGLPG